MQIPGHDNWFLFVLQKVIFNGVPYVVERLIIWKVPLLSSNVI